MHTSLAGHLRTFWISVFATVLVLLLCLDILPGGKPEGITPFRPFPFAIDAYPAHSIRGMVDHCLYRFGLFGIAHRIEASDILIAGSSHPLFGLSAGLLSEKLSQDAGHPVHVFNASLGYGESAFTARYLLRNHVHDKWVILDLYAPGRDGLSAWGAEVEQLDTFSAITHVALIWGDILGMWLTDPWLPRIYLVPSVNGTPPQGVRGALIGAMTRSWENGDRVRFWPSRTAKPCDRYGEPFRTSDQPMEITSGDPEGKYNRDLYLAKDWRRFFKENHIHPILVVLPFIGCNPARAETISKETGYPLVVISGKDLVYMDDNHVGVASRDEATLRLYDEIKRRKLIPLE